MGLCMRRIRAEADISGFRINAVWIAKGVPRQHLLLGPAYSEWKASGTPEMEERLKKFMEFVQVEVMPATWPSIDGALPEGFRGVKEEAPKSERLR
ncbi:hypothetical protein Hypma_014856 [Hypsizygus marmoreus]|uniref:Uncharacterized protein n=1 Tax=Hypsizygus marmoreus TaxID=39966 RepID=A0A369K794_HYPMA|nr:hypothetical protein Hypma_014856 [Hypsizygus marmoreus]